MPTSSFSSTFHELPASIKKLIERIIQRINPDEIILFGSRARGNHRENSDFDLAVKAPATSSVDWARLQLELEEEPITLFQIDLVDFSQLNDDYKKRISVEGKILYVRSHILL